MIQRKKVEIRMCGDRSSNPCLRPREVHIQLHESKRVRQMRHKDAPLNKQCTIFFHCSTGQSTIGVIY